MDLKLFLSTFVLIFLAELPDKTAVATLIMATGDHPIAVFGGVAGAFLIQSLVAVCFGSAFALLPSEVVKVGAGILFLVFSVVMWRKARADSQHENDSEGPNTPVKASIKTFGKTLWASFMVIFVSEWGDLTQLATAALQAKHQAPFTIFISATLALWSVTALAVFIGNRMKEFINPFLIQRIAAVVFFVFGTVILVGAIL